MSQNISFLPEVVCSTYFVKAFISKYNVSNFKNKYKPGVVVVTLISVVGRQRQEDVCEFKKSLFYKLNSRTVRSAKT